MKFAIRKWEPKIFKAETQTAAVAAISLAGYLLSWPPEATGMAVVVAGYFVGFITVEE